MCFFKKFKAKIETLQNTVDKLQKTIETNELVRLRNIQKQFNSTNSDLQNVKLKVKSVKYSEEERRVIITYDAPVIILNIDDNGEPELNKTFKAINMLNLIGPEDFKTIQNILKKIKPLS